jgi:hypothetical protein
LDVVGFELDIQEVGRGGKAGNFTRSFTKSDLKNRREMSNEK